MKLTFSLRCSAWCEVFDTLICVPDPATLVEAHGVSAVQYRLGLVSLKVGMALERGTVTGRARRCGWLDAAAHLHALDR